MAKKRSKTTDLQRLIFEVEKNILRNITDDIDFGYDLDMIRGKIENGSYAGSSYQTFKNHKHLIK